MVGVLSGLPVVEVREWSARWWWPGRSSLDGPGRHAPEGMGKAPSVAARERGSVLCGMMSRTTLAWVRLEAWLLAMLERDPSLVGVHCKQIMSHGETCSSPWRRSSGRMKKKVAPGQTDQRAGVRLLWVQYTQYGIPDHPVYTYVYEIEWRVAYRVAPVSLTATVSELCGFPAAYFVFGWHDEPR